MKNLLFLTLLLLSTLAQAGYISKSGNGNATSIQGTAVCPSAPSDANCMVFSSGAGTWCPGSCSSGTGTVTNVTVPSWLSSSGSGTATIAISAASGQTTHQVIGTAGTASFAPISLSGADLPLPGSSSLGGVFSKAVVSHNFLTGISSTDGSIGQAQPAFSDLSGSATGAQLPNPSASTLGGVESYASVSHQWVNTISTSGVPASSQPAFSDISGTLGLTSQVTGVLPLANGGVNTTAWASCAPLTIGAVTTAPTKGAINNELCNWRRNGPSMEWVYQLSTTSTGAANGSGAYLFPIPNSQSVDTNIALAPGSAHFGRTSLGTLGACHDNTGGGNYIGPAYIYDATHIAVVLLAGGTGDLGSGLCQMGDGEDLSFTIRIPISGWN